MRTGACSLKRWRSTFAGIPGAAHGETYPGATSPALAKLQPDATVPERS